MREIAYGRIRRGVLLASVGVASLPAAFLVPVTSAQACPPAHARAWGYWSHGVSWGGSQSGGSVTGHRIG
jgi:hypothetical protein